MSNRVVMSSLSAGPKSRTIHAPDTRVEQTLVDGVVYFDRAKDLAARTPPAAKAGGAK